MTIFLITFSAFFVLLNYSQKSWEFFYSLGGLALAKSGPEITGLIFFTVLTVTFLKKKRYELRIIRPQKHFFVLFVLAVVFIIARLPQFDMYFYRDDFYYYLNRGGITHDQSQTISDPGGEFHFGPYLSALPAWPWELTRLVGGYEIFFYRIASMVSNYIFGLGIYLLVFYLTRRYLAAFLSALFFLTSTIHFENYQWFALSINFGWQGLYMTLAIIALIWQLRKDNGKTIPLPAAFLMMAAIAAGVSRTAPILPILTLIDIMITFPKIDSGKIKMWFWMLLKRQWIFYALILIFMFTRGLIGIDNQRNEIITAPLQNVSLLLLGLFTFPPELIDSFRAILSPGLDFLISTVGSVAGVAALIYLTVLGYTLFIFKRRNRTFPLIVGIGFVWTSLFTVFYTFFGPHVPKDDIEIIKFQGSFHLAYASATGASLIFGYIMGFIIERTSRLLNKLFPTLPTLLFTSLLVSIVILSNIFFLRAAYNKFLDRPEGIKVSDRQFFFDSYRKFIPADIKKLNIYYGDTATKQENFYLPSELYFAAFWTRQPIQIIHGEGELQTFLKNSKEGGQLEEDIKNLSYIFIDYPRGVADDLSAFFKQQLLYPTQISLDNTSWFTFWGKPTFQGASSEITDLGDRRFIKPPVLMMGNIEFPAVISPYLDMTLRVTPAENSDSNSDSYLDVRNFILSNYIIFQDLPSMDYLRRSVAHFADQAKSAEDFEQLLTEKDVGQHLIGQEPQNGQGTWLFISWVGASDSWYKKMSVDDKKNNLSKEFFQKDWVLAFVPTSSDTVHFSIRLGSLGSMVRGITLVPLSTKQVNLQIIKADLRSPNLLSGL